MNFKFNKTLIVSVLFLSVPFTVNADNKITFTGKVIDSACTVSVNGGVATLDLGDTAATDIATKGQTGAPKIFNISLTSCPAAGAGVPTKAFIKFSGTTDGDETYFKNDLTDTNAAKNVAVIIKDSKNTAIINNDGNTAIDLPAAGGDLDIDYTASLVASAATPTKGDVSTTVTYTVSYE